MKQNRVSGGYHSVRCKVAGVRQSGNPILFRQVSGQCSYLGGVRGPAVVVTQVRSSGSDGGSGGVDGLRRGQQFEGGARRERSGK